MRLPVKELQYNRAPAVAPLSVLTKDDGWLKIHLTPDVIEAHRKILLAHPHFAENIRSIFETKPEYKKSTDPEAQLYDGFLNDRDRLRVETVRNADEKQLADYHPEFSDERLEPLLLHYKARNYPRTLNEAEMQAWEEWRSSRLRSQLPTFLQSFQRIAKTANDEQRYVLQEMQLWAESIMPADD